MVECQLQCALRLDFTLARGPAALAYTHYPRSGNSYIVQNASGGPTFSKPPTAEDVLRVCFPYGVATSIGLGAGGGRSFGCMMGAISSPASIIGVYTPEDGKRRYIIGALGGFPPTSQSCPDEQEARRLGPRCDAGLMESKTEHGGGTTHGEGSVPEDSQSAPFLHEDASVTSGRRGGPVAPNISSGNGGHQQRGTAGDSSRNGGHQQESWRPRRSKHVPAADLLAKRRRSSSTSRKIRSSRASSKARGFCSGKFTLLAVICNAPLLRTGARCVVRHFLSRLEHLRGHTKTGRTVVVDNEAYYLYSVFSAASREWSEREVSLLVSSAGRAKFWADVAFDPLLACLCCNKVKLSPCKRSTIHANTPPSLPRHLPSSSLPSPLPSSSHLPPTQLPPTPPSLIPA